MGFTGEEEDTTDRFGNPSVYHLVQKFAIRSAMYLQKLVGGVFLRRKNSTALADSAYPALPIGSWTTLPYAWPYADTYLGKTEELPSTDPPPTIPPADPIDTTYPVLNTFTAPAEHTNFNIPITAMSGSDNKYVYGYKITYGSRPGPLDGWYTSPYTTFPADISQVSSGGDNGDGTYTYRFVLFGWVMDTAGNISLSNKTVAVNCTAASFPAPTPLAAPPVPVDPTVSEFELATLTPTSWKVSISKFTGHSFVAISKYLITESAVAPNDNDPRWVTTKPTSYTFQQQTDGPATAYAWVKDAIGKVSPYKSVTVVITIGSVPTLGCMTDMGALGLQNPYGTITPTPSFMSNYTQATHWWQCSKSWDKGATVRTLFRTPLKWFEANGEAPAITARPILRAYERSIVNWGYGSYPATFNFVYPVTHQIIPCDEGRFVITNSFSEYELYHGTYAYGNVKPVDQYGNIVCDIYPELPAVTDPPGRPTDNGHVYYTDCDDGVYIGSNKVLMTMTFQTHPFFSSHSRYLSGGMPEGTPFVNDGQPCRPPVESDQVTIMYHEYTGMFMSGELIAVATSNWGYADQQTSPYLRYDTMTGELIDYPGNWTYWPFRTGSWALNQINNWPIEDERPIRHITEDMQNFADTMQSQVAAALLARGRRPAAANNMHTASVGISTERLAAPFHEVFLYPTYNYYDKAYYIEESRVNWIEDFNYTAFVYSTWKWPNYVYRTGIQTTVMNAGQGIASWSYAMWWQAIVECTLGAGGKADLTFGAVKAVWETAYYRGDYDQYSVRYTHPTLGLSPLITLGVYLGGTVVVGQVKCSPYYPTKAVGYYMYSHTPRGCYSGDLGENWNVITPPSGMTDEEMSGVVLSIVSLGNGLGVFAGKGKLYMLNGAGGAVSGIAAVGYDKMGAKLETDKFVTGIATATRTTTYGQYLIYSQPTFTGNQTRLFISATKKNIKTYGPPIASIVSITCMNPGDKYTWTPGATTITGQSNNEINLTNALPVTNCIVKVVYTVAAGGTRLLLVSDWGANVYDAGWTGLDGAGKIIAFTWAGGSMPNFTGDQELQGYIPPDVVPLEITSDSNLPSMGPGVLDYYQIGAIGGVWPYSWVVAEGSLPPTMNIDEAGVLEGIPPEIGVFNFTVQITDQKGDSVSKAFSLLVI